MNGNRLDYEEARPLDGSLMAGRAGLLAILSVMCVGVPVAGFVTRPGEFFVVVGVLVSMAGMALAILGMVIDRRAVVVCSVVLAIHVMVEAFFGWMIYLSRHC
jgi:hypothetical protein